VIDHLTTCLITTSPSIKHPSTEIIQGTVESIRWHLPTAEILICCDGVRPEQEHYRQRYSDFVLATENLALEKWNNVKLIVYPVFLHQAWTVASSLASVRTRLLLFTEWDQVLLPVPIPWDGIAQAICRGQANLCRFMLEDGIKPEWSQFMLGPLQALNCFLPLTKTIQWSQRTHLASVDYYRALVGKHLKPEDRCYLEDRLYGQCDDWEQNKLTIYTPDGSMARIKHTDGRGAEPKFASVLEGKE
jgi:hypothetical protein